MGVELLSGFPRGPDFLQLSLPCEEGQLPRQPAPHRGGGTGPALCSLCPWEPDALKPSRSILGTPFWRAAFQQTRERGKGVKRREQVRRSLRPVAQPTAARASEQPSLLTAVTAVAPQAGPQKLRCHQPGHAPALGAPLFGGPATCPATWGLAWAQLPRFPLSSQWFLETRGASRPAPRHRIHHSAPPLRAGPLLPP